MSKPAVIISHSEVESFLSCQQKHFYAFGDSTFGEKAGLEPKVFSDALFRGIIGHEALSVFYKAIRDKDDIPTAAEKSYATLRAIGSRIEVLTQPNHLKIVMDLANRILPRFYANEAVQALNNGWFPVHVEETFRLEMDFENGRFIYPFTPDAIMRDQAGNLWVWDHKFLYNFYSPAEVALLPQIPKYVGALRALGMPIKGGYYNQLRWREVKDLDKHVQSVKFTPTDARVKNAFRQQYNQMVTIADRKLLPEAEWQAVTSRVLSTMVCKSCSFKHLCAADLDGTDTRLMRQVEFNKNSYGYTEAADG